MNKKISFVLVAIMLAFSMVVFLGCEATTDPTDPTNLGMATDAPEGALFLYGGTPKVGAWQDCGPGSTPIDTYALDASYNPCIQSTSGTGWGNAYPFAFDAGSLTGMTTLSLKIKSDDYDYILIKIPGSTFGDANVQFLFDGTSANSTVTDVAGAPGWKKIVIDAAAVWGSLDAATQAAFIYQVYPVIDGATTPADEIMYLADIYLY